MALQYTLETGGRKTLNGKINYMISTLEYKENTMETNKENQFDDLAPEVYKVQAINTDVFYGHFQAVKNVSIGMKENTVTAFIGPSGCGKSTLLNILGTLDKPDSGILEINNIKIDSLLEDELAEL